MVNGPRPGKLFVHPATTAMAAPAAVSPARSPLLLQRQHTSIYSTCSTTTPNLVYGKAATPIAGAWSAEPWDASNFQPSRLTHDLEAPESPAHAEEGVASSAHDEDEVPAQHPHDDDVEVDARTEADTNSVAETATYNEARPAAVTRAPAAASAHVSVVYRHDPYSGMAPRREVFRCDCADCFEAATLGSDRLFATYETHPNRQGHPALGAYNTHHGSESLTGMGDALYSDDYTTATAEYDDGMSNDATLSTAAYGSTAYDDVSNAWGRPEPSAVTPATQPTPFIPPPPPPKITRGVMAESAEPSLNPDAAFYHIAMRWYVKVSAVQSRFVPETDLCPEPSEGRPFDDWVQDAGKWWLRHFEHAQVKTSASSGLLRSSAAPVHARSSGFETHASISSSYAAHKHALRSGPRKEFGTTGLTSQMLSSLPDAPRQTIPTPRSWRPDW